MSESCIYDEIPECPCVNGPIKVILLYIKKIKPNNYKQNTEGDSNNLSATSINNCETSENNVIKTTETTNINNVLSNNLAAPTSKKKFPTNTTLFKLCSTETEFNKRKKSSPIIRKLNTSVCNKAVEDFFK